MYLLPISGILRLEPNVDDDPDVMLVHMSRATAPVRVVGTLAEFLSLLPTDHVAARPHVSVKVENDPALAARKPASVAPSRKGGRGQ